MLIGCSGEASQGCYITMTCLMVEMKVLQGKSKSTHIHKMSGENTYALLNVVKPEEIE